MIVVMKTDSGEKEVQDILARLRDSGLQGHLSKGVERTVIGVVGQTYPELRDMLELLPGVEEVIPISKPYKLSSREFKPEDTVIKVGQVSIGGGGLVVMAGPCAVETEKQVMDTARAVKAAGAHILRGGAFKPSTSPYSFRGLGEDGLKILAQAREETGLPIITEVLTPHDVELVCKYADILQLGARNMQNFVLLDEAGKSGKPVMLKRGMSATIQEWLLSAEYILSQGNRQLMLCERGIRTFETYTRNTMDISAIPIIEKVSHLPIIADPSHGTGKWYLVPPLAMAAVAAGADGLLIEVHPTPDTALKDGAQSLTFENFERLMAQVILLAASLGRKPVGSPAARTPAWGTMRRLNPDELWERVRPLKGQTVYTLVQSRPNVIKDVTDTMVIIDGRSSQPTKAQIASAYEHVWQKGPLRLSDWHGPSFMLSVVPAIVLAAVPEQVEKIEDGGLSGIRLKR